MALDLILTAIALSAASGLPGLLLTRRSVWGQRVAAAAMTGSAMLGLAGSFAVIALGPTADAVLRWPAVGDCTVGADALSAFFLAPVFLMGGLGSIYGLGYWPQKTHPANGRKLRLFWGFLTAGMALLVIARHGMALLAGWEVMALSAFFLVSTEDNRAESRRAAWIYLIATHLGTLTLFGLFALWRRTTGSYLLVPVPLDALGPVTLNALFFLALLGFGMKAGVMPLHFWLPGAHAAAPSHVSAMLSGVMLKMGVYGLIRVISLLPQPPGAWGGLLLTLGAISGVAGVLYAIGQHDLKRLLAYHSIENIGIILMGLGLAVLGRSSGQPAWEALGMAACLLHVWNHCLFKALLFFGAGAVVHAAGTREIDRLGGLARKMPWTAALFLAGAVAICGLPPLNGFVSEWLLYMGLFHAGMSTGSGAAAVGAVAPVLAMIGALAVACFVKAYGAVFLGEPRSGATRDSHEAPLSMRAPMLCLAACCVAIGLVPMLVVPVLDRAIAAWGLPSPGSASRLTEVAQLGAVGRATAALLLLIAVVSAAVSRRGRPVARSVTWDCGYAAPTARMQYTASSFAQMLVTMFGWALRPTLHGPRVEGLFPGPARMASHVNDAVLDRLLMPSARLAERGFAWLHRLQQGLAQQYVLYVLIAVIVLMSTLVPAGELLARLFAR